MKLKNDMSWMVGPRYLCRRYLILKLIEKIRPENILEIGFGNGDLIKILSKTGYNGKAIDFSSKACKNIRKETKGTGFRFVIENIPDYKLNPKKEKYSLVMAFEVLEHIKNDWEALSRWGNFISKDGYLMLSVPAHMSLWGANDDFAGHIRRYEKKELQSRLEKAGFKVIFVWSYGYPLINAIKRLKDHLIKGRIRKGASLSDRTKESGIKSISFMAGRYIINDFTLYPAYIFQRLFLNTDLGTGYLVMAKRR